jgi:hypothetical protein
MGALAQYFFWRWHISGEPEPGFRYRKDWYRIKLLVGKYREEEISYPTQLEETYQVFGAAGIHSVKKTHAMRGSGARGAELHGVSERQVNLPSLPFYQKMDHQLFFTNLDFTGRRLGHNFHHPGILNRPSC